MRVYLIGYMGSGKSRFGRRIAQETGLEFIDLDHFFETRYRIGIPDFFQKYDENAFRRIESSLLKETAGFDHIVVSTGGGTPCFFDNMDTIKSLGFSVYLQWSVPDLVTNLWLSKKNRPLIRGIDVSELEDFIRKHLLIREPYYLKADTILPVTRGNPEKCLEVMLTEIRKRFSNSN